MPQYFVQVSGRDVIQDQEGWDLPDAEAVRKEAFEAARELLCEGAAIGEDRQDWMLEMKDEAGHSVFKVRLKDALVGDDVLSRAF